MVQLWGPRLTSSLILESDFELDPPRTLSQLLVRCVHRLPSFPAKSTLSIAVLRTMSHTRDHQEGSCDLQFGWNLLFQNDGDRRSSNSWNVLHLGRRLHAQVSREVRREGVERSTGSRVRR